MLVLAITFPLESIENTVVPPYLIKSLPPDSVIEKFVVDKVWAAPAVKLAAVPVAFVATRADGVPKAGVTRVGLVDKTTEPEQPIVLADGYYDFAYIDYGWII